MVGSAIGQPQFRYFLAIPRPMPAKPAAIRVPRANRRPHLFLDGIAEDRPHLFFQAPPMRGGAASPSHHRPGCERVSMDIMTAPPPETLLATCCPNGFTQSPDPTARGLDAFSSTCRRYRRHLHRPCARA